MSELKKQTEAYRMARRILRATNRLPGASRGPALRWCSQRRYVLADLTQRVRAALKRRQGMRVEMKRRAIENLKLQAVQALSRTNADTMGWPGAIRYAAALTMAGQFRAQIMNVAAVPARQFRHDRPELDPKRYPSGTVLGVCV